MALIIADMVQETTTTTGYGDITLAGAVAGCQTFNSAMNTGDTCDYHIIDGVNEERGLGTFTDPNLLARTTVYGSTNSGSKINLASGSKFVFITLPAIRLQQMYAAVNSSETAITTTANLALSSKNVCSGTSANYTVTLPTASGNTGTEIEVRISNACTKLITVAGNGSETIDGSNTRVMWAGESAKLRSDGTEWVKVAGKSRPMVIGMERSGDQVFSASANTKVGLNAVAAASVAPYLADTSNNKITAQRPGLYGVEYMVFWNNTNASAGRRNLNVFKNGSDIGNGGTASTDIGISAPPTTSEGTMKAILAAGDYIELFAQYFDGTYTTTCYIAALLQLTEIPTW